MRFSVGQGLSARGGHTSTINIGLGPIILPFEGLVRSFVEATYTDSLMAAKACQGHFIRCQLHLVHF